MTETSIEATVQRLADSSGGQILASTVEGLRRSLKWYLSLFTLGFVAAFPLTRGVIAWLIDADRLPSGVDIIVVSPVEFLFLQLRMAGSVGLLLVVLFMIVQVTLHGVRHQAVQARLRELEVALPRPGPALVLSLLTSLLLVVAGLLYAWHGLIPMLLDYLTTDAQQAGLSTEWRLSGYAGFVVNLLAASAIPLCFFSGTGGGGGAAASTDKSATAWAATACLSSGALAKSMLRALRLVSMTLRSS